MSIYIIGIICVLLIICIIYAGKTFSRFFNDMKTAQKRIRNINSKIFKSKYGDIEYILEGNNDDTIMISHGITGGVDQAKGIAKTYLNEGYRFLYVSRFGYLKSDLPESATPKMQADAYSELLDYLGIDRTYILGNSAGGTSAFYFAINHAEKCKGLILLSTNFPQTNEVLPPKLVINTIFSSNRMYWLTVQLFDMTLFKMFFDKETLKQLSKDEKLKLRNNILMPGLPISERRDGVLYDMYVSNPYLNTANIRYEDIKVNTLIIHASDDPGIPIESAQKIANKISGAKLEVFDEGGHVFLGHEDEIKKKIDRFINH